MKTTTKIATTTKTTKLHEYYDTARDIRMKDGHHIAQTYYSNK